MSFNVILLYSILYNIYVGNINGDILMRKKIALLTSQLEDD